jgi:hypothetical protein
MATATTERLHTERRTNYGSIASKTSIEDSSLASDEPKLLPSLYGFIREFPREIKTFSFWSHDRNAANLGQGQRVPPPPPTAHQYSTTNQTRPENSQDPSNEDLDALNASEQQVLNYSSNVQGSVGHSSTVGPILPQEATPGQELNTSQSPHHPLKERTTASSSIGVLQNGSQEAIISATESTSHEPVSTNVETQAHSPGCG